MVVMAAFGGSAIAAMLWGYRRMLARKRASLAALRELPELQLKELVAKPRKGLLGMRARTDEPVRAPWSDDEVVAAQVIVTASRYGMASTPANRGPRILAERVAAPKRWRTKRGTTIHLRGDLRIATFQTGDQGRHRWDDLPEGVLDLLEEAEVNGAGFSDVRVLEHAVAEGDHVLVLGSWKRTDDGFSVKPARPASAIYVYVGSREELLEDLEGINITTARVAAESPALLELLNDFHSG